MYRLCSIRRSYIKSRSSTLAFEKSFMAKRPRGRWGADSENSAGRFWPLKNIDWVSFANGLEVLGALRASMAWFWILQTRFSRQERLTMRSASIDSIGLAGANS